MVSLWQNKRAIMQDFIGQAEKNGVTLLHQGKCQFCAADYQGGIFECMENYNRGVGLLEINNPAHQLSIFLSVDAHALQHPEIHGRWSNHFHLTRLHLILEKKLKWSYKVSPILSSYLNEYKSTKPDEILIPPAPMMRGRITAKDIAGATTAEECVALIRSWANEVCKMWSANHLLISKISDGFYKKNERM
jgi:hypothetical protein